MRRTRGGRGASAVSVRMSGAGAAPEYMIVSSPASSTPSQFSAVPRHLGHFRGYALHRRHVYSEGFGAHEGFAGYLQQ